MNSGRILALAWFFALAAAAYAQDNYEIQVYASELVLPRTTMVEIHSNFTVNGSKTAVHGVEPTHHAEHETLEITQGFTDWFETGFYVFSSIQPNAGWEWVGNHIRPRFAVPERGHGPVGISISQEVGYTQARFTGDTWTYELRPIIDKTIAPCYLAFNPTFGCSLHGPSVSKGWEFSPNVKISYGVTKKIAAAIEYYGTTGPATEFEPISQQQHQIFPPST